MKEKRYLAKYISELAFDHQKMAFVSGPRQCGKTTMAKMMLQQRGDVGSYYNWDEIKFRRQWKVDPSSLLPEQKQKGNHQKPLVIFDELHKAKLWKRDLKGLYDTSDYRADILITGSARLNVYRKSSDSLLGRYYHFRLHPFSLAEISHQPTWQHPDTLLSALFSDKKTSHANAQSNLKLLLQFGPFPEPLFSHQQNILNLWQRNRLEKIIREDLRDLSRLPELSQIEILTSLLPERAAQPLSIQSLSEILEVAYSTTKRWLHYLNELYYCYVLSPYSNALHRAIKKEKKLYLWDWSEIDNEGARFENCVASHLLKYCHFLTDIGVGNFELCFLKNKEKMEIDFLITKNKKPFLPIEVKLSDVMPNQSFKTFLPMLPCDVALQLVLQPSVREIYRVGDKRVMVISAADFLNYLV